jgi:hypothetical protein
LWNVLVPHQADKIGRGRGSFDNGRDGTVMLKVEASSFNPVRTPLVKTSNRYSEIFNTNVPRYSDCHLQLRRSDGKVSEKIHLARGMDVSFLM